MSDNPLNAQQLQQIQANAEKQVLQIVERLKLRQWAVEQAFAAVSSTNQLALQRQNVAGLTFHDPMALANAVYDFIIKPANVKIELSP